MEDLTYMELIAANLLVSQCCVCDAVVGYKDAGRELKVGDLVVSHTYCDACMKIVTDLDEFTDVDY